MSQGQIRNDGDGFSTNLEGTPTSSISTPINFDRENFSSRFNPPDNRLYHEVCDSFSQTSLNGLDKIASVHASHYVPVCLHQGLQAGSPVLITLPFQSMDNMQTFVPCTTCHRPNLNQPSLRASETVAFCVSEVNIRTSQLTLVPCFLCWKPTQAMEIPDKITVPLFPTISKEGNDSQEESVRFVPCTVCLEPDHGIVEFAFASEGFEILPPEIPSSPDQYEHKVTKVESSAQTQDSFEYEDVPVSWFVPMSEKYIDPEQYQSQSLQVAFLKHCSNVVQNSRQRQRDLTRLAEKRFDQVQKSCKKTGKPKIPLNANESDTPSYNYPVFTHKSMREQTERICKRLPESKEISRQKQRDEMVQTHRIMAYIFQKRLQRATLRGKVSWQITESCL